MSVGSAFVAGLRRPARERRRPALPGALIAGVVIVACSLILAFFPWLFSPFDPLKFDYKSILKPPSLVHPFGTDNFGRDMLARTIHAYTLDMQIAFFATIGPMLVGTAIGTIVGYYGGLIETIFGRLVDGVITFPFIVLVIAIVAVLGPGLINMYIAIGLVGWVFYARLVAGEMKVQKRLDYADAGRVMGYGDMRIAFRHLLPNAISPALVYWMTDMALCILLGTSLGYLGLGAQPPAAEWGVLIAGGKNYFTTAWWISIFPGIAIVISGLGFSLLGNGLAELMKVKR